MPTNPEITFERVAEKDSNQSADSLPDLFEAEEPGLLRYACALTGRRAVAEEIVQDVFLQLHANWSQVDMPRAWLYRSVRNRGLDHLRKSKRERLQCDHEPPCAAIDMGDLSPAEIMTQMEAVIHLRQSLQELSESDRNLICLKYFEGRKYREISEQTGMSIGNVGFRLHQIIQRLARRLEPLRIDESK